MINVTPHPPIKKGDRAMHKHNGDIFIAAQVGTDPKTGKLLKIKTDKGAVYEADDCVYFDYDDTQHWPASDKCIVQTLIGLYKLAYDQEAIDELEMLKFVDKPFKDQAWAQLPFEVRKWIKDAYQEKARRAIQQPQEQA